MEKHFLIYELVNLFSYKEFISGSFLLIKKLCFS